MEYRKLTDDFAVSGQIMPTDVSAIRDAGFRSIICNRPDDEQPGQPASSEVKAKAEAAGLEFRYVPAISGQLTQQNVDAMAAALDELDGPVFAYCRSGARSANLYSLALQARG